MSWSLAPYRKAVAAALTPVAIFLSQNVTVTDTALVITLPDDVLASLTGLALIAGTVWTVANRSEA